MRKTDDFSILLRHYQTGERKRLERVYGKRKKSLSMKKGE